MPEKLQKKRPKPRLLSRCHVATVGDDARKRGEKSAFLRWCYPDVNVICRYRRRNDILPTLVAAF